MHQNFADTAALFSDAGRAAILLALMDGKALPAGELAIIANVSPQTTSSHLAKLVAGGLLSVEPQGRHRYYRLATTEVAQAVEAMMSISPRPKLSRRDQVRRSSHSSELAYARTCYSHLAGRLAVNLAEAMQQRGLLALQKPNCFCVTAEGRDWLIKLDITVSEQQANHPRFARCCLDWTERRHHIAGHLGSAMLVRFRELNWIAPIRDSRAVRVTLQGERKFWELLRVNGRAPR